MIVTSVQIKTAKTQKHLYCLVFTSLFHNMEHIGKPLIIQGFFVFLGSFNVYCPTANICLFPYPRQTRTHKRIKNLCLYRKTVSLSLKTQK